MRGHVHKRGDRWRAQVYIGPGPNGRKLYRNKSFRTKREADAWLADKIREVESSGYVEVSSMTVSQWLSQWLEKYAASTVAPKTLQEYGKMIAGYAIPWLGHLRIARLRGPQIQQYYSDLLGERGRLSRQAGVSPEKVTKDKDGRPCHGGLSAQTVLHHHTLLHKAFRDAVRAGYIPGNPVDSAIPPRPERKEVEWFTPGELLKIRQKASLSAYYLPILLAMYTGMRRSEVCGLQWRDIDFDAKQIRVQRSMEQTKAGLRLKETKTKRSRRQIPMCKELFTELQARKGNAAPDAFVVTSIEGGPVQPNRLSTMFTHIRRSAGINRGSLHMLRHTFVSTLLNEGVSLKVLQELVGHSTIVTTMDRYGHLAQSTFREAIDLFEDTIGGAAEQVSAGQETPIEDA